MLGERYLPFAAAWAALLLGAALDTAAAPALSAVVRLAGHADPNGLITALLRVAAAPLLGVPLLMLACHRQRVPSLGIYVVAALPFSYVGAGIAAAVATVVTWQEGSYAWVWLPPTVAAAVGAALALPSLVLFAGVPAFDRRGLLVVGVGGCTVAVAAVAFATSRTDAAVAADPLGLTVHATWQAVFATAAAAILGRRHRLATSADREP